MTNPTDKNASDFLAAFDQLPAIEPMASVTQYNPNRVCRAWNLTIEPGFRIIGSTLHALCREIETLRTEGAALRAEIAELKAAKAAAKVKQPS